MQLLELFVQVMALVGNKRRLAREKAVRMDAARAAKGQGHGGGISRSVDTFRAGLDPYRFL
jgi:hypothetical protein